MPRVVIVTTGREQFAAANQAFPEAARRARLSALITGVTRIGDDARARLETVTHGTGATAAAIFVQVVTGGVQLAVRPVGRRPNNVPLWIEFGTKHQRPRPYFMPAVDGGKDQLRKDVAAANDTAIADAFAQGSIPTAA